MSMMDILEDFCRQVTVGNEVTVRGYYPERIRFLLCKYGFLIFPISVDGWLYTTIRRVA